MLLLDKGWAVTMRFMVAILTLLVAAGCGPTDDRDLAVTWRLETNFAEGGGHRAIFTLRNAGDVALTDANWELYWNMSPREIDPASITGPVTIEWIDGDFFVMRPTQGFQLAPGEEVEVGYEAGYAMIKESDGPAGLYLLLPEDGGPARYRPVTDYAVAPFERPEQINRDPNDVAPIPTAEWLFDDQASITMLPAEDVPLIVPTPRTMTRGEGEFAIDANTVVTHDGSLEFEATLLAEFLSELLPGRVAVREGAAMPNGIHMERVEVDVPGTYLLQVAPGEGATIAGDGAGVFYGTQSLRALIAADRLGREGAEVRIPVVELEDVPAFGYRGMHLDVARNFHSVASVKRLLDVMAFYKLNRLHLHLTEDEGWRLAIEELPELTEVGGFRGHTLDDADYLHPSYGSGPFPDTATGSGSGFYSRAQFVDVLRYASARHIEVIPEINMPGHARAAIKAMEHRYRRLMAEGRQDDAERYRLVDPADTSKYRSAQWYSDNVINVCRESALTFETTVIDDVIEMYAEAGAPLSTIHTGGDEVPTGVWAGSPMCQDYLARHPEVDNPRDLQREFFRRVQAYINSKGLRTAGWEEIAMRFRADGSWTPNDEFAGGGVVPYVWNNLWGNEDLGNRLANAGYPVVWCNVTNFYFDLAYTKDPREPGQYWGGFVNTRDAFAFVPYHIFRSIAVRPNGVPYTDRDFVGKERLTAAGRENIQGMQGHLWSETIHTPEMLEHYYLPKMLGLAERAWRGQASWGDIANREARNAAVDEAWNVFANALGRREFPRLDRLFGGYDYRLAPPGAKVVDGQLVVNTAYPGMTVRYTTDGSGPTADSREYTGPLDVTSGIVKLSTFDSRGRGGLPTVVRIP